MTEFAQHPVDKPERKEPPIVHIAQRVAMLIDANNIERGIREAYGEDKMLNYLWFIPKVLRGRGLVSFLYFVEGAGDDISPKLMELFAKRYFGNVIACFKSADVPLSMHACMLMSSVDTFIIFSGDSDYIDCVNFLRSHGKRVEIVGVEGSVSSRLAGMVHDCIYIKKEDVWRDAYKYKKKSVFQKSAPVIEPLNNETKSETETQQTAGEGQS